MRMTEKIERFFNLDEEEKEILRKASKILLDMGEAIVDFGEISLCYAKFTEPVKQTWSYDEGELFDFANFLSTLSNEERIDIE